MRLYLFSLEIEPMTEGAVAKMPLHCTLMQWFRINASPEDIIRHTEEIFRDRAPIRLMSLAPALFGFEEDVPVHTVEKTTELMHLHTDLYRALFKHGACFANPQWVNAGFRPHVTTCGNRAFTPGSVHITQTIWLIEKIESIYTPEKRAASRIDLC